jgi:hypothetical protein|tara:strand:- start:1471 stop:1692 length:222 start_codon:yes stop_codon:yes gene_type:complete
MPNPGKYKSVGVSIEAYDKLIVIAEHEDRAIGRQLARMIDETYEDIKVRVKPKQTYITPTSVGIGGLTSVLED